MSTLSKRQIRALTLVKRYGGLSDDDWRYYLYSKGYVTDLTDQGLIKRTMSGKYQLTAKGEKALG